MMIKKLLPLLLLILIGCSEPEMINGDFIKWGGDGFYHKNTGKIFTGNVYELKSKDNYLGYNIYERGFIKNGRQEGTFTSIYRDPTHRERNIGYLERDFKDGELQFERGYYHSKELYYQFEFKYGKKDGLFNRYSRSGEIRQQTHYKNGRQEGLEKYYYENGQVRRERTWEYGSLISSQDYDTNGKKVFKGIEFGP